MRTLALIALSLLPLAHAAVVPAPIVIDATGGGWTQTSTTADGMVPVPATGPAAADAATIDIQFQAATLKGFTVTADGNQLTAFSATVSGDPLDDTIKPEDRVTTYQFKAGANVVGTIATLKVEMVASTGAPKPKILRVVIHPNP